MASNLPAAPQFRSAVDPLKVTSTQHPRCLMPHRIRPPERCSKSLEATGIHTASTDTFLKNDPAFTCHPAASSSSANASDVGVGELPGILHNLRAHDVAEVDAVEVAHCGHVQPAAVEQGANRVASLEPCSSDL